MRPFEKDILTALSTVPSGMSQRLDGLRCERGVIEKDYWFFGFRLFIMERKGLIKAKRFHHSIFPSANGIPWFAITDKGRELIK